eukprot:scaffold1567_cov102-Cylindrotheca_fusiformis.AAC.7
MEAKCVERQRCIVALVNYSRSETSVVEPTSRTPTEHYSRLELDYPQQLKEESSVSSENQTAPETQNSVG